MTETISVREAPLPETLIPAFIVGKREAVYYVMKRAADFLIALILLILLSPLMLFIAIAVRFDSKGPAIYSQKRVGCRYYWRNNNYQKEVTQFTFYKFRTMVYNTDDTIHRKFIEAYIHNDLAEMTRLQQGKVEQGNQYKLNGDKRITRIGKTLRKLSIDELPQLWNILRGEMSLVGPRPAIPYEVELYEPWQMQRLSTLPGLTGLWQVTARNSAKFDDMVRMDLEYIANQSFWLDMKILIKTPLAVIDRKCN